MGQFHFKLKLKNFAQVSSKPLCLFSAMISLQCPSEDYTVSHTQVTCHTSFSSWRFPTRLTTLLGGAMVYNRMATNLFILNSTLPLPQLNCALHVISILLLRPKLPPATTTKSIRAASIKRFFFSALHALKLIILQCPRHNFRPDTPCPGFVWRNDLSPYPWGSVVPVLTTPGRAGGGFCENPECSYLNNSTHARPNNVKCTQLYCKECCLKSSLHCRVSVHNRLGQSTAPDSPLFPRISPSNPLSNTPLQYAKMISPVLAEKLLRHDFSLSPFNSSQKDAYRMEAASLITVKWWSKVCLKNSLTSKILFNFSP